MIVEQVEDEDGSSGIRWKQYGDQRWRSERFSPYFYVDASEEYIAPRGVDARYERNLPYRAYDGTELHKVILETTRDARDARDAADNHYEADIPFERRYYIDRVEGGLVGGGDISDARPNIAHLDIEVWADGGQVDALEADEPVISASVYFERSGRHVDLLLDPPQAETESDPDWAGDDPVLVFDEEAAMLRHLGRVITGEGVEVLCGWNIGGYDIPYLIKRFDEVRGVEPGDLSPLGESYVSTWTTDEGERRIRPTVKGVDLFDMMEAYKHLKRRDKPPNWRLGTVAEYEGTDVRKMDVDASRIGPVWESRPMEVMEYNRADAELTHHIAESVSAFDLFLEMHRAFAIPLSDTLNNSVLVEMYVMSRSEEWGIRDRVLDSKRDTTGGFEGGNTKQPDPGRYEWVFGADVTSEYPNWVRAANLSPETVVTPEDPEWGRGDLIDTPMDGIRFLPHDERLGILPRAVDEMFQMKRDKTELRSEHEYGSEAYQQADLERDATKWFLNSIQGVTGMETHRLSKVEVSAAITAFGRETVERMVEVGESMGYDFVYGDSVPPDEPVLVRGPDGVVDVVEIQELNHPDTDVEVWTDDGWSAVKRVIRKPNRKQMYSVRTRSGNVRVTEDHSLVNAGGDEIRPGNVDSGDTLLTSDVSDAAPETNGDGGIGAGLSWLLGAFVADGHAGVYDTASGVKRSWKVSDSRRGYLEKVGEHLDDVFGVDYKIDDTTESSGCDQVRPVGVVKPIAEAFRKWCYTESGKKRVPVWVLNADEASITAFLDGYWTGDGADRPRYTEDEAETTTNSATLAAGVAFLLRRLGHRFGVDNRIREDGTGQHEYYRVRRQDGYRGDPGDVSRVDEVEHDGEYVFDLETENGHFQAGVGDIVVHNTDSAFFVDRSGGIGCTDDAVEAAHRLAEETNDDLPEWARDRYGIEDDRRHRLEVEPEKVAKRAFFPSKKKRYTLWIVWDDGQDVDKISHTGWAVVRSDTSAVEETAQRKTLEAIMHNRDESFVTRKLGEEMHRVVDGEYDPIDMARPQGSSKAFARYGDNRGTEDFENVPYFVAAMMSSNELLGTDYRGGDKTWMLPVKETETVEVNGSTNNVNYLAVDEDTDLPDWVEIDYDKVLDNIVGKVRLVYESLGWDLGRLKTHKSDALGKAEVERVQANNHTLGVFSS